MKIINLAVLTDILLTFFCTFIFIFTLVRYYTKSAGWALFAAVLCGLAAGAGAYFYISRKRKRQLVFGREAEENGKLKMHLCLLPFDEACQLLIKATGGQKKGRKIFTEKGVLFPVFKAEACDMDDVLYALKSPLKEKIFVCLSVSDGARKLAEEYALTVWENEDIYQLLKKADALPETYLTAQKKKLSFLQRVKNSFNRKLCVPAFWSGAALMFMSRFTFYPAYYITFGALLLALCVAAAIFGNRKRA